MSKQDKILISVIIPSYNRADTVGETIESIVAQEGIGTEYDLEIVIGDDCSTDNAREVLEQYRQKYPDLIRLFLREQNVGLGANWAMCVKDCRGKYICNCDNDDYWHNPQKLHLQLEYMESHPECNICITNNRTHNRGTGEIREYEVKILATENIQDRMYHGGHFCNATIMYRADFMTTHLDLDEFIKRRLALQDWPAWVILTAHTGIDVLPISTATFGVETVSITRPDTYDMLETRYARDRRVCEYLGELFPDKYPYSDEMWDQHKNTMLMYMAYRKNDYWAAKRYGRFARKSLKQKCTQHVFLFKILAWGIRVKKMLECKVLCSNI